MALNSVRRSMVLILVLLLFNLSTPAPGQHINTKSTVIGTGHDGNAGGNGCQNCHGPHRPTARGRTLVWMPPFSTQIFGVYDSPTMDNIPAEIGNPAYSAVPPTGAVTGSILCMSCHDGITSPMFLGPNSGAAIGNPANSAGLTDDHPVNVNYDPSLDPGLMPMASVLATNVRLFFSGPTPTVQCASCHDVHEGPGFNSFLRVNKNDLCAVCHGPGAQGSPHDGPSLEF